MTGDKLYVTPTRSPTQQWTSLEQKCHWDILGKIIVVGWATLKLLLGLNCCQHGSCRLYIFFSIVEAAETYLQAGSQWRSPIGFAGCSRRLLLMAGLYSSGLKSTMNHVSNPVSRP